VNPRAQSKVPPPEDVQLHEVLNEVAWNELLSLDNDPVVASTDINRLSFTQYSVQSPVVHTAAIDSSNAYDKGYDSYLDGAGNSSDGNNTTTANSTEASPYSSRHKALVDSPSMMKRAIGNINSSSNNRQNDPFYLGARDSTRQQQQQQQQTDSTLQTHEQQHSVEIENDDDYAGVDKKRSKRAKRGKDSRKKKVIYCKYLYDHYSSTCINTSSFRISDYYVG
jgi:hypothetical protein